MRDLVSTRDLSPAEVRSILDLAAVVKARPADFRKTLEGKQLVMFFEKPSLRTRLTFEAGMTSLGGNAFFMDQTGGRIDARESLHDIALGGRHRAAHFRALDRRRHGDARFHSRDQCTQ